MGRWLEGLGHLDQDTMVRLGVEERDHPGQAGSRGLINQREVRGLCRREGGRNVRGLEAEVVKSLSPLLQKSRHASGRIGRLQELDLPIAHGKQRGVHTLVGHGGSFPHRDSQDVAVHRERLLHVTDDNGYMVNPREHGTRPGTSGVGKPGATGNSRRTLTGRRNACQGRRYNHSCRFA